MDRRVISVGRSQEYRLDSMLFLLHPTVLTMTLLVILHR